MRMIAACAVDQEFFQESVTAQEMSTLVAGVDFQESLKMRATATEMLILDAVADFQEK